MLKQEFTVLEHNLLQKYHTYIVGLLIDSGVITDHLQISVLQNSLNAFIREQQADTK